MRAEGYVELPRFAGLPFDVAIDVDRRQARQRLIRGRRVLPVRAGGSGLEHRGRQHARPLVEDEFDPAVAVDVGRLHDLAAEPADVEVLDEPDERQALFGNDDR